MIYFNIFVNFIILNTDLSNLYYDGSTMICVAANQLLDYTATSDGTLIVTTNNSSIGYGVLQFPNVSKSIGFANTISINIKKGTRVTTSGAVHIAYFIS